MKCETAQEWLLQCESLQPKSWPRGVVKHLRVCTTCYQFGKGVKRLERAWRNLPVPAECEPAKANFLAKLADLKQTERHKPKRGHRPKKLPTPHRPTWGMRWLAVAACLFIGIIGVGLLIPGRQKTDDTGAIASANVVDRIVEWSVDLAKADSEDRKQLFDEYEGSFRTDLKKAVLAPEERQLGEELLDLDGKLAVAADPLAEAEIVTAIADKLMSQAVVAVDKGNKRDAERSGIRYGRFNSFAVKPMWNRLQPFKTPDSKGGVPKDKIGFDKDKGFPKTAVDQKKKLDALYQRSPEIARPDLHKQFDALSKKGGPPGPGVGPGIPPKTGKK